MAAPRNRLPDKKWRTVSPTQASEMLEGEAEVDVEAVEVAVADDGTIRTIIIVHMFIAAIMMNGVTDKTNRKMAAKIDSSIVNQHHNKCCMRHIIRRT